MEHDAPLADLLRLHQSVPMERLWERSSTPGALHTSKRAWRSTSAIDRGEMEPLLVTKRCAKSTEEDAPAPPPVG